MDLDKEARKKTMPLFLDSKLDKIKLDDTIFNEVIKTNEDYTFFKVISKKNKMPTIHTLFCQIDGFILNRTETKKIYLNKKNRYFKSVSNFIKSYASSYEFEETDEITHVV